MGAHGPPECLLLGVCWSVASPCSSRPGDARREVRGGPIDHAPLQRWGVQDRPPLDDALPRRPRAVGGPACEAAPGTLGGIARLPRSKQRQLGGEEGEAGLAAAAPFEALAPFMTDCIARFGPDRCMFESNFPPDKVSFSHHVLFNAFKRFSTGYSAAERAARFHDTAARVYRIDV
jgi:Amidohydrolase